MTFAAPRSEHGVAIGRILRHDLQNIPVLDNLPICIETEDIDASPMLVTWPFLITMKHDMVVLGNDALEVHALARVLLRHSFEVCDECLLSIRYVRIVLDVGIADKLAHGLGWLALIEHEVIEAGNVPLVALDLFVHSEKSPALQ